MRQVLGFSILLWLLPICHAFYSKKDAVVQLDGRVFNKLVLKSNHVWIVEFYAPWCGHCKNFAPTYKKVAKKLEGVIKVGAIDCDENANKAICGQFQVKGFPTVKLFPGDKYGKDKKIPVDYEGARDVKSMLKWALARLPGTHVKNVQDSSIDEFYSEKNDTTKILMFTDKAKTPALLKSLSLEYKNKLVVGEVKKKNAPKLVEQFGIDMFPALYVIPVSEPPKGYFGALQMDLIQKFLKPYLPATKFKAPEEPSDNPVQKIEYDPLIREVKTIGDFDEGCTKKAEVGYSSFCFMAFLPPLDEEFQESKDQREQLMDILKQLNRKFYGFIEAEMLPAVHFMFMDGFSSVGQDIIRKFGLSSDLPSGMILSPKKKLYIPLFTSFDEDSLTKYIKEAAKGKAKIFKYDGTISLPSGDATEQEAQEEKPTCGSDIDDLDDEESGGQCTFKNKDEL